ncbi:DUF2635 domain-containing protein [Limnobaculum zhutongyuii]|uniref:DUF2635 domain-containing protein n=1 Tax=Limnobaculum zhutongyuii TaxID=2498113 RepID=A0A411WKX1_9GAMM|nr:DUF2635 domain-containing protein [Limnobaculum zhutongyuii]QBH96787.1 DUF2635 domain-containing protein [Limnobaculum zhutongyuii]TQS90182.1 DUF2635 domain-containing protein [Limnobaculum zhutongyuii]
MSELHIRPVAGRVVRDPETNAPLASQGEKKPKTSYWQRRLMDGDVELVKTKAKEVKA